MAKTSTRAADRRKPQPGAAPRPFGNSAGDEPQDWLKHYNVPPAPIDYEDQDPLSQRYVRNDIDETPGTILHYWFGYAADRPAVLKERIGLWFDKSFETDRAIANRFADTVARLASGEARRWAERGPRDRLAAIIALDQFSRNIFRDTSASFENDALALELAKEGLALGDDAKLKPVERWFFYMPFEHSESASDQRRSVARFADLLAGAAPEYRDAFASAHDFAKKHASVIRRFGRFPHRNEVLGRQSTLAEFAFLSKPGSHF